MSFDIWIKVYEEMQAPFQYCWKSFIIMHIGLDWRIYSFYSYTSVATWNELYRRQAPAKKWNDYTMLERHAIKKNEECYLPEGLIICAGSVDLIPNVGIPKTWKEKKN